MGWQARSKWQNRNARLRTKQYCAVLCCMSHYIRLLRSSFSLPIEHVVLSLPMGTFPRKNMIPKYKKSEEKKTREEKELTARVVQKKKEKKNEKQKSN